MTETFILTAFRKMAENPLSVKIMRNKFTGEPAGYCFVHFANDEEAIQAMHKLNGKPIPNTAPTVRFRLNNASNTGRSLIDREFSVWVGDLSPDVDDYNLYRVFSSKYNTIKTAKGKFTCLLLFCRAETAYLYLCIITNILFSTINTSLKMDESHQRSRNQKRMKVIEGKISNKPRLLSIHILFVYISCNSHL